MPTTTNNKTTRDFVEISEIRDFVLILKNGSLRSIIEVGSVNFALKSADEQTAITLGFQDMLNSIDFPFQILVHSRKLNIDRYIRSLDSLGEVLSNELLRIQAIEYARFIKGLTELADIISKKFYLVIPFYAIEATNASKKSILDNLKGIFRPAQFIRSLDDKEFSNYKVQLEQRIDLAASSLASMGLPARILGGSELQEIFYAFYNPDLKEREINEQGLAGQNNR